MKTTKKVRKQVKRGSRVTKIIQRDRYQAAEMTNILNELSLFFMEDSLTDYQFSYKNHILNN